MYNFVNINFTLSLHKRNIKNMNDTIIEQNDVPLNPVEGSTEPAANDILVTSAEEVKETKEKKAKSKKKEKAKKKKEKERLKTKTKKEKEKAKKKAKKEKEKAKKKAGKKTAKKSDSKKK